MAPQDTCPQCLNAGTVNEVSVKNSKRWPHGQYGMCGDAYSDSKPRKHEAGGEFYSSGLYTTYAQGQVMDIHVTTTTNHNGKFGFRICKVSGGYDTAAENEKQQLTEECFDQHILKQAHMTGVQSPGDRWFYTTPGDPDFSEYSMQYQLPENLTCDGESSHCILQWYWLTIHACNPTDFPEQYLRKDATYQDCDVPGAPYPEEFWNCADVVIKPPEQVNTKTVGQLSNGVSLDTWMHPSVKHFYEENPSPLRTNSLRLTLNG